MDFKILSGFAFSADGAVAVHADGDGKVRISHQDHPEPLPELGPMRAPADSVALSPDGELVATGSRDGVVGIWDAGTGAFRSGSGYRASNAPVTRLAFSADGRRLASGGADGVIAFCDVQTMDGRSMSLSTSSTVTSLAFAPSGESVAIGCADGIVAVGPIAEKERFVAIPAHSAPVFSLLYSPDGTFLVSGGEDGTASSWNAATGEKIADRAGESAAITAIAVSPDGGLVVTGDEITHMSVWDPRTGEVVRAIASDYAGPVRLLAVEANETVHMRPGPVPPQSVTIAPDGRVTVSPPIGAEDVMVSSDGEVLGTPATVATMDMASSYLFASGAWDGTVALWDLRAQRLVSEFAAAGGVGQRVTFAPDGDLLALTSGDNTVRILDTRSGQCLSTLFFDCLVTADFRPGPPLRLLVGDRAGRIFEYEIANWAVGEAR